MITDIANVMATSLIDLLKDELGRDEPECIWLTTNTSPGVGCCDAITIQHRSISDGSGDIDCVSGPFDVGFRVGIMRCKPAVLGSRDALTTIQEMTHSSQVQDERWVISRFGKTYLSGAAPRVKLTNIQPYDDASCSGTVFDVSMRVPGTGLLGAIGINRHLLYMVPDPQDGDLLRFDSGVGAFVPSALLKSFGWVVFEGTSACAVGDGEAGFAAPAWMTSYEVVDVQASVSTPGTTGTMDLTVRRVRAGAAVNVTATPVTVDSGAFTANDSVIDAGNNDIQAGDMFYVDRDAVHETAAKGLSVIVTIQKK